MNSISSDNSMYSSNNKHNPWAGLASYEDPKNSERKLKFCGREDDCYDLVKLIVHNTFVTLYGKSGIGKTSLLNAGVFPELREEQYQPLYLRLGMREDDSPQSYQSIILDVIKQSVNHIETINVVDEQQDEQSVDYLWNFFVRHRFYDENNEQVTLVIVFDQFEEVLRSANRDDADILLRQLDYVNNNEHSFDNYEIDGSPYHYKRNCRFVVSIREDYLYRLEDVIDKNYLPSLKRCRYRLLPLSLEQAESIIVEPVPNLISLEVAKEIICKITGAISCGIESSKGRVREKEVEPVLLSLFLSELYKRKREGCNTIDKSLVEQFGDNIIQDFYIQTMSDISEDFVKELEDVLITSDGKRNNVFESSLVCCKNTPETTDPIKSQELNWLKEQRIIREFPWNGAIRIEFVHDVLCDTIVRRKKERKLVALRAEEERLRKLKYRNTIVLFIAVFLLLTMFLLIRTNITESRLNDSLQEQMAITQEKNDSLQILTKLNYEQMLKTQSLNHSLQEQMGITQRKNDSLHALMILNEKQMIITKLLNDSLHEQMTITQRKNDSLLTLVRLNEEKKTFIQTNINEVRLNFAVGKASIVEDSTTLAELKKLAEQVKSFEVEMLSIVIEHSASPEGNLLLNKDLARRRAEVVKEFLYPYSGDIPTSISVTMHTWFDVANLLYNEGFVEESKAVAQAIANSEGSIELQGNLIRRLPFYSSIIKATILPQLRTTTCKLILK